MANRPICSTVPVTPPAVMKSPTLNGRSTTTNTPAAKLESSPAHAAPTAMPMPATNAANDVVCTPKYPRMATTSSTLSETEISDPR